MEEESNQALTDGELFGQYKVRRMLGEGGMGQVYEVEHQVLETRHAIKLINPAILEYEESLQYFRNEARVMANLNHPGIVDVDDFGQTEGYYWLRLELIPGIDYNGKHIISLDQYIHARPDLLNEFEVHAFLKQALNAIGYAHSKGVIHCDLKPANILLYPRGAKIADFGIVRLIREDFHRTSAQPIIQETQYHSHSLSPTETAIMGTYEYMSPEQRKGLRVDGRSDLYAIGLIAYQMLTGHNLPCLKPATDIRKKIHHAWDQWLQKALEENPADRFRTAQDMMTSLPNIKIPNNLNRDNGQHYLFFDKKPVEEGEETELTENEPKESSPAKMILLLVLVLGIMVSGYYFITHMTEDEEEDGGNTPLYIPPENIHGLHSPTPPSPPTPPPIFPNVENLSPPQPPVTPPTPPSPPPTPPEPPTTPNLPEVTHTTLPEPNPPTIPDTSPLSPPNNIPKPPLGPEKDSHWTIPKLNLKLLWIPEGSFQMGSPEDEPQRSQHEGPQHKVELTQGFWLAETETTIGQWNLLTPESPLSGSKTLPAHSLSWLDAIAFCNKVEALQKFTPKGYQFRLPTEAEWEYACRAGTDTPFYFGTQNDSIEDYVWYGKNAQEISHPVGSKKPNAFGLYNMHGNVREWCMDLYAAEYLGRSEVNPTGPTSGNLNVSRGGSWRLFEPYCRSAARKSERNSTHSSDLGFRIALAPEIER